MAVVMVITVRLAIKFLPSQLSPYALLFEMQAAIAAVLTTVLQNSKNKIKRICN